MLSLVVLNPSTARAGDTLVEFTVPNNEFEIVPLTGNLPPNWNYFGQTSGLSLSNTEKFSGLRSMRFVKTPPPPPPAATPPESELNISGFTPTLIGHLTFDAAGNLWGGAYGLTAHNTTTFAILR